MRLHLNCNHIQLTFETCNWSWENLKFNYDSSLVLLIGSVIRAISPGWPRWAERNFHFDRLHTEIQFKVRHLIFKNWSSSLRSAWEIVEIDFQIKKQLQYRIDNMKSFNFKENIWQREKKPHSLVEIENLSSVAKKKVFVFLRERPNWVQLPKTCRTLSQTLFSILHCELRNKHRTLKRENLQNSIAGSLASLLCENNKLFSVFHDPIKHRSASSRVVCQWKKTFSHSHMSFNWHERDNRVSTIEFWLKNGIKISHSNDICTHANW